MMSGHANGWATSDSASSIAKFCVITNPLKRKPTYCRTMSPIFVITQFPDLCLKWCVHIRVHIYILILYLHLSLCAFYSDLIHYFHPRI